MKIPVLLLSVISLLAATRLGGAEFRSENISFRQLDNGLKILLYEDHDIPNIAYYTFFRVGSRNERPGLTGVSHFIEHMMFNGSAAFGPGEFDRIMEFNGGANNAYTSEDMTAYTDWFPRAALEKMMAMEADRMRGLSLDPAVLESERGVIASERRLGVENDNDSLLDETVRATAMMAHPYHWGVIGWMSDILSWKRDEIIAYYKTYYAPNNAVFILVGDFESAKALALIEKYYAGIPAGPPPPAVTTVEPPQMGPKQVLVRKEAQAPSFTMVFHTPACASPEFYPLNILESALLNGDSSRLYRRLVRDEQLAIDVGGGMSETIDPQLFTIDVKPRPGADLARIEAVIEEELAKVKTAGVTAKEFQKAMNEVKTRFYAGLQTIAGKAGQLGHFEIYYGGYEKLFTVMDAYQAVTLPQVQEAAKKYFTENNKTVGRLVPEGGAK